MDKQHFAVYGLRVPLTGSRRLPVANSRRSLGSWVRFAAVAFGLFALLGATATARSYTWCAMLERVVAGCCDAQEGRGLEVEPCSASEDVAFRCGCCSEKTIDGELAADGSSTSPPVPPCPLSFVEAGSPEPVPAARWSSTKAGALPGMPSRASPPRAIDRCVALQVFRC